VNAHIIIGILSFCVGMTGVILGNMFQLMMIGEIKRKRQQGDSLSYVGFWPAKIARIHSEYRGLYPNGKLHLYTLTAFALQIIGFVTFGVCLLTIG
jgi:hypothetical protein